MAKLAVDIVLLPPEWVMDKAIEINKRLVKVGSKLVLDKQKVIPHMSLAMGVLEEAYLLEVSEILSSKIAPKFMPIELHVTGGDKEEGNGFSIERTPKLQALHEEVMQSFLPFFTYEAPQETYFCEINPQSFKFLPSFKKEHAFENFNPHITLGKGNAGELESFKFTATRIAICHLGDYNTCRKILFECKA
ncbi:MAG: hypothetical protein V1722_02200 [Candidatus Micrarchaeota archaeon]